MFSVPQSRLNLSLGDQVLLFQVTGISLISLDSRCQFKNSACCGTQGLTFLAPFHGQSVLCYEVAMSMCFTYVLMKSSE